MAEHSQTPDFPLKISDGRQIGTITWSGFETGIAHGTIDDPIVQSDLTGSLELTGAVLNQEQLLALCGVSSKEELDAIGPEPARDCEYCGSPMPVDGYGSRYCPVCMDA